MNKSKELRKGLMLVLSSPSGFVVESFGWSNFFIFSTFLGIPGLFILFWMKKNFSLEMQKPNL